MKLSMVELSPVPPGGSAIEAFADSIDLAQRAEAWGYSRFWVAEHHGGGAGNAGSTPEVLIARIAAETAHIRVGSGTVLLNHYSPYKVAETFRVLHAMSPGRIDLGLGRANGLPVADYALQRDRSAIQRFDDYPQQVAEVLSWLGGVFPGDHPFSQIRITPGTPGNPEPWVLGSSPDSAVVAGTLGLRYCFAGFINPRAAITAAQTYREHFRPSSFPDGIAEPYVALGINVTCAETDAEAARLRSSVELFYRQLRSGTLPTGLPAPEEAIAALGGVPGPSQVRPGSWSQHISGGPDTIRDMLQIMADDLGAEEIVLQDMIARREDRLRSYALLADTFELSAPATARAS
ncbi:MAG TPA: LLM class flavin-dependent oxidoreductase [Amycolatopsis sp.]|nr:LLM class flavin-dependent oxidoreductase [Amycolatopsis sp.]